MKLFVSTLLLGIILLLSSSPIQAAQVTEYNSFTERKIGSSIRKLIARNYELIITDIDRAEKSIDSLWLKLNKKDHPELLIDLLLLEAEMYRSKGDNVHMKLAYYQAVSWKNAGTQDYQKLHLGFYQALNEGIRGNEDKKEKMLLALAQKTKASQFYFLDGKINQALGKLFAEKEDYNRSHAFYIKARESFKRAGYDVLRFDIKIARGINFFREKKYNEATFLFHEARSFAQEHKSEKCYANALLSLAESHLFIGGNEDSSKIYLDSFSKYFNRADIRDVFNFYWTKEHYFLKQKNTDSAYYYLNLQAELDNELRLKRNQANNEEIDSVFKRLQNERKLQDEGKKQENLKLMFVFIGLFLLCFVIILWLVLKEKSKYNYLLMSQKDEILHKKKQIDVALREKEILLKEIHHRVKNNLQIISSLLSLQSKNIDDESAREAILEGKERIQAIALIHQKLYQDDTFATIEMSEYLGDLITQLEKTYNETESPIRIVLQTNGIILNIDTVVPLGLIICELVTNAFKYAFEEEKAGKLKVEIDQEEEGIYRLVVKDNGKGMNSGFNYLESQTLGVEIITALTDQLEGEISYKSSENGTSIRILFKEIKHT